MSYAHLTWATLKAPIHKPRDTIFLRHGTGQSQRKVIVQKDVQADTVEPWMKKRGIPYTTGRIRGMVGHGAELDENQAFEFRMFFG